jgi:hypothetical protein
MKIIFKPDRKAIVIGSKRWCIVFYYYLKSIAYWDYDIQRGEHLFDYKYLINLTTPIFSISFFQKDSI